MDASNRTLPHNALPGLDAALEGRLLAGTSRRYLSD